MLKDNFQIFFFVTLLFCFIIYVLGIEQMADHFKETGIGAIWLSPIYKSPMADFGYDIADFKSIDKTFGTMDDFLSLQKKLKSLGKNM